MNFVSSKRNYAIDWLRVFAMFTVFLFHCARFFDRQDWHVKNPQSDTIITFIVLFLVQWIMPLFFILSGISSYYSLGFRKAGEYVRGRFKRLMLFVFSLLTLPFFIYIQREPEPTFISKFISFLERKGTLFLLALPLAALEMLLDPATIGRRDFGGWSPFLYLIFFIYGYVVLTEHRLQRIAQKQRNITLAGGLITATTALAILISKGFPEFGSAYFFFMTIIRAFNTWLWLLAIIGFGLHYCNFNNKFLAYANEAVLPFYILHQTIIVTIAFYLIGLYIPVGIKYFIIASTSMIAILALYEIFIRRLNILRFLFGLRPKT